MPTVTVFEGYVDQYSISVFLGEIQQPSRQGRALISSEGGQLNPVMEHAFSIGNHQLTTIGDVVASAAVVLYALGSHRLAHPDTTFGFHPLKSKGSLVDNQSLTIPELRAKAWMAEYLHHPLAFAYWSAARDSQNSLTAALDLLVSATQTDRAVFINLMDQHVTLSAEEALRLNLVHQIVPIEHIFDMFCQ